MAGAILSILNTHHDSAMVAALLTRSQPKIVFVDYQFLDIANGVLKIMSEKAIRLPCLILIPDPHDSVSGMTTYDSLLAESENEDEFVVVRPDDECDPISLCYTSGTTSTPKCVVYSHRGAYLNSLSSILLTEMKSMPVYLWTVPMVHCNGWCQAWAVAAQGGTNICLRNVTAEGIFDSVANHRVTHMGGAPTILNMISNAGASERRPLPGRVAVMTGGAPPHPRVLSEMEEQGFDITHAYGLTETYGPGTICAWQPEWDALPLEARAKLRARQGVQHLGMENVDVKDPVTMQSVARDGKAMGEVMFRGNTVMSGYYNDIKATEEAFRGGWFRTGDWGVMYPDGYIEVKDRSIDVIVSGGENISSIEVEAVIFSHPAVFEAAVVGRPDEDLGETPCAFLKLKEGHAATEEEIMTYCRERLPHYKVPRTVVFEDLPKTSTGKTQKYALRARARAKAITDLV
ncbi:butanoate--CoA ligase AAE1-like [Salvia hispanica]|uniref:butanoate--CoA ligase AAE1-like n=1 Tax=Salvia hispanica TaxID=49212 RepID=UPI002009AD5D|nr:butanoate--CoA ligase AAE1-like [Salvia hispanica]